jgi:hypothetical protein
VPQLLKTFQKEDRAGDYEAGNASESSWQYGLAKGCSGKHSDERIPAEITLALVSIVATAKAWQGVRDQLGLLASLR